MRRLLLIVLAAVASVTAVSSALDVRWNASPSVAPGLYVERQRPPGRGDLVAVCLPEPIARWARGRGYLRRGSCPGGSARLGKLIAAVEGDHVEVRDLGIAVNGRWLEATRRVGLDSRGRPVPLAPVGELVLGPGELWLHSGRRVRSFDSRIFGPLEVSRVQGVLEPVWVGER